MIHRISAMALILLTVSTLGLAAPASAMEAGTYKIDPVHSSVIFGIPHLGITYVYGRFNTLSGTLTLGDANAIQMTVDAASVDTNNEKRDKHLRSEDFFNVASHPEIAFESDAFTRKEGDVYAVSGDLTLHGVTQPVTVEARHIGSGKDPWGGYRTGFQATFRIRRSEYGMDQLLNSVGDEVELTVAIEAIRQ
jgi:polyisoprenoid-binding protein YceI